MKRHNISKNDVLREIYLNLGIPIAFSGKILDLILQIIVDGLNKNSVVKISGFGTFKLRKKKSRTGRNPMSGKEYQIKSRNVVTFHPSVEIKKKINGKQQ
tara:strand:+ start:1629 stop:1928 length:300 start_codon:yes stop_codon:yes gene_type:complete